MAEAVEWRNRIERREAAAQAWNLVAASAVRGAALSLIVMLVTVAAMASIAPALRMPLPTLLVPVALYPLWLLLAPLIAFVSPSSKYRLNKKGLYVNGRRNCSWREVAGYIHPSSGEDAIMLVRKDGGARLIHLADIPNRAVVLAFVQSTVSQLPASEAPQPVDIRFTPAEMAGLLSMAMLNAFVVGAFFPFMGTLLGRSMAWLLIFPMATPAGVVATGLLRRRYRQPFKFYVPFLFLFVLLVVNLSVAFGVAFLVRHASLGAS